MVARKYKSTERKKFKKTLGYSKKPREKNCNDLEFFFRYGEKCVGFEAKKCFCTTRVNNYWTYQYKKIKELSKNYHHMVCEH